MPVLDATFLVQLDKALPAVHRFLEELIAKGEPLLVPAQAAIEWAAGTKDPAASVREIRGAFVLVPCGPEIALEAARLARSSRKQGAFPGWADIQVAATATHEGMAIVTNNAKHFAPLGIETIAHP